MGNEQPQGQIGPDPGVGHETEDIKVRPIAITGVLVAVVSIATALIIYALFQVFTWRETVADPAKSRAKVFDTPQGVQSDIKLQVSEDGDWVDLKQTQETNITEKAKLP